MEEHRTIAYVDLDAFFAQAEELRHPELRGKPLVIGVYSGRTATSGVVSSANYLARERGVHAGMPLAQALRRLEHTDATFLPVDQRYYAGLAARVVEILSLHATSVERVSIDEAYLDVTDHCPGYAEAAAWARQLKNKLHEQTGLTCSLGIAPNKLLARIAANHQRPDGLTVIPPTEVDAFLAPLAVTRLPGVGPKIASRLSARSIQTISQLRAAPFAQLCDQFGQKLGKNLYNAARGVDAAAVRPRRRTQLSRIVTLPSDSRQLNDLRPIVTHLAGELTVQAEDTGYSYQHVSLIVIGSDLRMTTRGRRVAGARDATQLAEIAIQLLRQYLVEGDGLAIRRLGLRLSDLGPRIQQPAITSYALQ